MQETLKSVGYRIAKLLHLGGYELRLVLSDEEVKVLALATAPSKTKSTADWCVENASYKSRNLTCPQSLGCSPHILVTHTNTPRATSLARPFASPAGVAAN